MQRGHAGAAASVERFFQFSVLGLVTSGYLAVASSGYLNTPTIVLVAAGFLLRGLLIAGRLRFEFPLRLINAVTLAYVAFFFVDYLLLSRDLPQATVHLLFFLAVIKVLTARTNRDYLFTSTVAFLELLAAAILSASASFFAFLALYLLCAAGAFTSAEIRRSLQTQERTSRPGRFRFSPRFATLATVITVAILVITSGLFFVLPRTASAALSRFGTHRYHLPGFSNEVTLDEVGEIQTDSRAVMHIKSYSPRMPANLKWRGAALSHFDGKRWSERGPEDRHVKMERGAAIVASDLQRLRKDGDRIFYRVDVNGIDSDALFVAGIPEWFNVYHGPLIRTSTDAYRLISPPGDPVRYEVSSFLPSGAPDPPQVWRLSEPQRTRYLQVPPLDPRIPELAREIATGGSDYERAFLVQNYLRNNYAYTLELPSSEVPDPIANFLFHRRKGHCEYFASAMAVLLRVSGIPSRLVDGFQSGTYNPISDLYVIRASDAHSWVEAFMPDRGWTVFDPTPPGVRVHRETLWSRAALYLDAADTFWQEWIMSYDLGHQAGLLVRLEQKTRPLRWMWADPGAQLAEWKRGIENWLKRYGAAFLAISFLAGILIPFGPRLFRLLHDHWRFHGAHATPADATLLYGRMLQVMKTKGYQKPPWFTPREFAATTRDPLVEQFTAAYNSLRFGHETSRAEQMAGLLQQLKASAKLK